MSKKTPASRYRTPLLWLAGLRLVLGVAAIPLAPFLYKEHFLVLVLMRPTKEVLLAAGFLVRRGDVNVAHVVLAALPLCIGGVWQFFYLGKAFAKEIQEGKGLPKLAERVLPTEKLKKLCKSLGQRGPKLIFLGRLASFPSALLGAAAGASEMKPRGFLPADGAGGLVSIGGVLLAGYLLGAAYKSAGPWLAVVGLVALVALVVLGGRSLSRDPD